MRKNIIYRFTAIIFLSASLLAGCSFKTGSGDIVTETRTTGPFDGISVSGDFDVEIKKGDKEEVIIEADDNLIKNIEAEVVRGILRIHSKDNNLRNVHFKVYIKALAINSLSASASASIKLKDALKSNNNIELKASSAGEIEGEINAPEIVATASSGAEITLSGRTRNLSASSSSGSSIKAMSLLTENSVVKSSSGATAKVHASVSLDASASSGANIAYRGGAAVKKSVSSGAEVEKEN
jgi:hypothetical protein